MKLHKNKTELKIFLRVKVLHHQSIKHLTLQCTHSQLTSNDYYGHLLPPTMIVIFQYMWVIFKMELHETKPAKISRGNIFSRV